jgi:hypothetical protein
MVSTHIVMCMCGAQVLQNTEEFSWYTQYEYKLSRDNVVNGACILVCTVDIGTQRKISARKLLARRRRNA